MVSNRNEQGQQLPAWTLEQVVGTVIGLVVIAVGFAVFLYFVNKGFEYTPGPRDRSLSGKYVGGLVLVAVGAIPLGFSLYSRWRSLRSWRAMRR